MQKNFAFILPSVVQKRGTYSKHSSPSSELGLPATQDVWLVSSAEDRRSNGKLRLILISCARLDGYTGGRAAEPGRK